jgi:hypothetical protein
VGRKGAGRKKRKVIGGIYFVPTIINYALRAIVS